MEKNSNELTNVNESSFSKILKKISSFFKRKNNCISSEDNSNNENNIINNTAEKNNLKDSLSSEYNELQRLTRIKEQLERDERYIENISTEDLIKLTEMNKREIQEVENQIKREKATA